MNPRDPIFLSINDKLADFSKEFSAIYEQINKILSAIGDLKNKYLEIDKLKPLSEKFENTTREYINLRDVTNGKYDLLKHEFDSFNHNICEWKKTLLVLSNTVVCLEKSIEEFKTSLDSRHITLERHFQCSIEQIRKELHEEISVLRKDIVVPPKDVFKQNQEIMQKMEAACLDGSNAMLKVNNQDTQFRILEKKIENISIQLKKLELSLEERKV